MMRTTSLLGGLMVVAVAGLALSSTAHATLEIEILCTSTEPCGKYTGTAADGTIFIANSDPTNPSTGTGVFQPFKRVQEGPGSTGQQNGFNTDAGQPDINFDTKAGLWTRSVLIGEFEFVNIGGQTFFELDLDANESGRADSEANQIVITELQIFIGSDPNLANPEATNTGIGGTGYTGTLFDANPGLAPTDNQMLGQSPVWNLDSTTNGDVDIVLQASICETAGQCGSGQGDLSVFIPTSLLGPLNPNDFFVFYSEYEGADSGFEEWRFRDVPAIPQPGTLALFAMGLLGLGFVSRRRFAIV